MDAYLGNKKQTLNVDHEPNPIYNYEKNIPASTPNMFLEFIGKYNWHHYYYYYYYHYY